MFISFLSLSLSISVVIRKKLAHMPWLLTDKDAFGGHGSVWTTQESNCQVWNKRLSRQWFKNSENYLTNLDNFQHCPTTWFDLSYHSKLSWISRGSLVHVASDQGKDIEILYRQSLEGRAPCCRILDNHNDTILKMLRRKLPKCFSVFQSSVLSRDWSLWDVGWI